MKALSVKQPWAGLIAAGLKTIELRSWSTKYRGPLLICAGAKPAKVCKSLFDEPYGSKCRQNGMALAVVRLHHVRPAVGADIVKAYHPIEDNVFAWEVSILRADVPRNMCPLPFDVKGRPGLFDVDVSARTLGMF